MITGAHFVAAAQEAITQELIQRAEKDITKILATLEADTNMVLETITVNDTDVTQMGDDRQQLMRRVMIEMKRLPGSRWAS